MAEYENDPFQHYIVSSLIQYQRLEPAGLYAYIQNNLNAFNNFLAKPHRDRDRGDDRAGYRGEGGIKGKWGDGDGIHWEGYVYGGGSDGKGNYWEGEITQRDDGSGEVDIRGGHESFNE